MRRTILMAMLGLVVISQLGLAQQANQNINVLPPVFVPDPGDPPAHLVSDSYLQRQVEPTIVASTRNPDHLMAFYVDYRAVDIPDDPGLGETQNVAQMFLASVRNFFTRILRPSTKGMQELPAYAAVTTEAWIGCSRSYDGGITWSGCFVPGGPFDLSQISQDSPAFGLEAATDPVAWAAPCGFVHLGYIAFTRGGDSRMLVTTYQDQNNLEGSDTWQYIGTSVVETGNNADHGYFIDKPFLIVDPDREDTGDSCAHNIYTSYSTFNGQDKHGNFRSKITFSKSSDYGQSWSTDKLNPPYHQNQGTWMTIDPFDGTIYLFWRHFIDPNAILMMKSIDGGQTFKGKPTVITGDLELAPFDQPTLSTSAVPLPLDGEQIEIAFRSNGFPTAAVGVDPDTGDTTVLVAWQERVDVYPGPEGDPNPNFGQPCEWDFATKTTCSPRIMLMSSTNGGAWKDAFGNDPEFRRAVDMGDRDDPQTTTYPEPGFGSLPEDRFSGPQVMPTLSCGGGRCMLTYLESRGFVDPFPYEPDLGAGFGPDDQALTTGWISRINRVMDLRAALLDPGTGQLLEEGSTTQVSRYTIRADAPFENGEESLDDVDAANHPCSPDDGVGMDPCRRAVNEVNKPQSAGGTAPFIGDYNFLTPIVQFIPNEDPAGPPWRWATFAEDVPYQAFRAIWADNRNVIPPTVGAPPEYLGYQQYGSPGLGGSCLNSGAKNTDTLTARVNADLILSSPTSYKQLSGVQYSLPFSVMNGTGTARTYYVAITDNSDVASFHRELDRDTGSFELYPYSSTAQVVFVDPVAAGVIRVEVTEITAGCEPNCSSGSITFNLDDGVTAYSDPGQENYSPEVSEAEVSNPFAINPFAINPFAINTSFSNPFAINPFAINPFAINALPSEPTPEMIEGITDTTWTIDGGDSNTAASLLPLINIDNLEAYLGDPEDPSDDQYAFQLAIYRTSSSGGFEQEGAECITTSVSQDQMISNVVMDPANPFAINPFAINPFAINTAQNPFAINPFAINSAFTVAPSDGGSQIQSTQAENGMPPPPLVAPRAKDVVKVTLRAYPLVPEPFPVFDPRIDKPSGVFVPLSCDPQNPLDPVERITCNIAYQGPDLVATGTTAPPATAGVGELYTFPAWTLENQGNITGTAENRILRHGFYLAATDVDLVQLDQSDEPTNAVRIGSVTRTNQTPESVVPGTPVPIPVADLLVPPGTAPGFYNLILFVDDYREVSEVDEPNNQVVFPIEVITPNTAPVAVDDDFQTNEDVPPVLEVVLNDNDLDLNLDPASANIVCGACSGPSSGILVNNGDGTFTYTPAANIFGTDSFVYQVCDTGQDRNPATDSDDLCDTATVTISVIAVNDAPIAVDDDAITNEETSVEIDVLVNDLDVDGDALTILSVSPPSNGVAMITVDDKVQYTPNANFCGNDSFEYLIQDLVGDRSNAIVNVQVACINDVPWANPDGPYGLADFTYPDNLLEIDPPGVLGNDGDADNLFADPPVDLYHGLSAIKIEGVDEGPFAGSVDLLANGSFTYVPDAGYFGPDSFKYVARDAYGDDSEFALVTILVQYDFIGLLDPWKPNPIYTIQDGSAMPVRWQYVDPATGTVVESSDAAPEVIVKGFTGTAQQCPNKDLLNEYEDVRTPGNSTYQYDTKRDLHQLNWDSTGARDASGVNIFQIYVTSVQTGQVDGPFCVKVRK